MKKQGTEKQEDCTYRSPEAKSFDIRMKFSILGASQPTDMEDEIGF